MHRIDDADRLVDANGSGKDGFTEEDPDTLVNATVVTAAWLNDIQETLAHPIESEGIALEKGNFSQLTDLIYAREDKRTLAEWREVAAPTSSNTMQAVADSGSRFVACGTGGKLQHSMQGQREWTEVSAGGGYTGTLYAIGRLGTTWIAVGTNGGILTSTTGTSWTLQTPAGGYTGTFYGFATNGTVAVIVGTSGEIQTSTDGVTWIHRTVDSGYSGNWLDVACAGNTFVAVGTDGEVQWSVGGGAWAHREGSEPANDSCRIAALPDGSFILAKHDGSSSILVRKSTAANPTVFSTVATLGTATTALRGLVVGCSGRRVAMLLTDATSYPTGYVRHARVASPGAWTAEDGAIYGGVRGLTYARKAFVAVGGSELATTAVWRTARHA